MKRIVLIHSTILVFTILCFYYFVNSYSIHIQKSIGFVLLLLFSSLFISSHIVLHIKKNVEPKKKVFIALMLNGARFLVLLISSLILILKHSANNIHLTVMLVTIFFVYSIVDVIVAKIIIK